ncbi:alpha-galactosidase [Pseudovibrio sp. SPO723]|uniref:alpha-galactosidase n=1 Tax=Nesiotobacter zosterae TaxID=392721 RepID=UPI0029C28EA1|nr:alpha-galactosidase [Pseudovibrio sp. SPO723]MDX5592901.1 alpha-galactosidase [Pseudovibrio sp. SPO723]
METGEAGARCWRLDGAGQTMVFAAYEDRVPALIYMGEALPLHENLEALAASLRPPVGQVMLDEPLDLTLTPEAGRATPGHPGIRGDSHQGQNWHTQFRLTSVLTSTSQAVEFELSDSTVGLTLNIHVTLDPETGVAAFRQKLTNSGGRPYAVDWLNAACVPVPQHLVQHLSFEGRWCNEFREQRADWQKGIYARECRLGRTSHEHFPGFVALSANANDLEGQALAFHLGWSGNYRMVAQELPDGRRSVQYGALLEMGEVMLSSGESYETPVLYVAQSSQGLSGIRQRFHAFLRSQILQVPEWYKSRPVHYNCWEAVYFDHSVEKLSALAEKAADAGAELFVLDDGWFGKRDDDTSSLGDWFVDENKYPHGLTPLINHVKSRGLRFGIWFEPEMINEDSELYRAHPDWILHAEGRDRMLGRNQLVLDLTRSEVQEYLFERIHEILSNNAIDYIKWDMNRSIVLPADQFGRPASNAYVQALYSLLGRLRKAHPDVVIESCSSGGGRIDYEILKYTQRVWLSDSNDARERWRMQAAASLFLPPEVMGSHVGPDECHTSGRRLSMNYRGAVAASCHMGYEADLTVLGEKDLSELKGWSAFYKKHRKIMHDAHIYVHTTSSQDVIAMQMVSRDQDQFLLFVGQQSVPASSSTSALRLTGLAEDQSYTVSALNPEGISVTANRVLAGVDWREQSLTLSGASLMRAGVALPIQFPETMLVFEGRAERDR